MSAVSETLPAKQTTIAALKPQPEQAVQNLPVVRSGFDTLQAFELMQRGAKLLASSTLVPKDYQGNLPNCVIALNMAQRIGADPLLVMQNLYVVHGRPGWSAQFLIACFNQCGRFAAIRYRWQGTKGQDDWGCQAYAKEHATGEVIEGPEITIALSKKEGWYGKAGSKWQTIPQLMLMYRAAAWLVRTHAPEISMGLQTQEEIGDFIDAERGGDGSYAVTTESLRQAADASAAAAQAKCDGNHGGPPCADPECWALPEDQRPPHQRIDKTTGEVITTDPKPSATAELNAKTVTDLRAASTAADLNKVWKAAKAEYKAAGAVPPLDVETSYSDRLGELSKAG